MAMTYFDLLARRREPEATEFVRAELARGEPLDSIYADTLAPALDEMSRRFRRGESTAAQERFAAQATDRIMSVLEPPLLKTAITRESVVCRAFGSQMLAVQLRLTAARLCLEGYDVCVVGPDSTLDEFGSVVDQTGPAIGIFYADLAEGAESLIAAVACLRSKRADAFAIVGGDNAVGVPWVGRCLPDLWVTYASEAVSAVREHSRER